MRYYVGPMTVVIGSLAFVILPGWLGAPGTIEWWQLAATVVTMLIGTVWLGLRVDKREVEWQNRQYRIARANARNAHLYRRPPTPEATVRAHLIHEDRSADER